MAELKFILITLRESCPYTSVTQTTIIIIFHTQKYHHVNCQNNNKGFDSDDLENIHRHYKQMIQQATNIIGLWRINFRVSC